MRFHKGLILTVFSLALGMTPLVYGQQALADETPDRGGIRFERVGVPPIVGSWVMDVQADPPFAALHTFHAGGTMSETSNLLATLTEGPAQGAWEKVGESEYATTFELFIFDPDHAPAGRIRVRETLTLVDADHLTGLTIADLILPDGTVIESIGVAPISGTRITVREIRAEEKLARPAYNAWGRRW